MSFGSIEPVSPIYEGLALKMSPICVKKELLLASLEIDFSLISWFLFLISISLLTFTYKLFLSKFFSSPSLLLGLISTF
jgi:hypothetical protein